MDSDARKAGIYHIGCDVYRRWISTAILIEKNFERGLTICDIGGDPASLFYKFLPSYRISTANPQYGGPSGTNLTYESSSFDIAMSVDTLEHIPKEQRAKFISEMLRISRRGIVLAAPFDTVRVAQAERVVYEYTKNPFLAEHIECGLPDLEATLEMLRPHCREMSIDGNDSLQSWTSWLLLHNLRGVTNLQKLNMFLNQSYIPFTDPEPTYRKIIVGVK